MSDIKENAVSETAEADAGQDQARVEASNNGEVSPEMLNLKKEVSALSRKNNELIREIENKNRASKTLEERMADLERSSEASRVEAARVRAFSDADLGEAWRNAVLKESPDEQALAIRGLLDDFKQSITREVASKFAADGTPIQDKGDKPYISMAETEHMTIAEINAAFEEGRIR